MAYASSWLTKLVVTVSFICIATCSGVGCVQSGSTSLAEAAAAARKQQGQKQPDQKQPSRPDSPWYHGTRFVLTVATPEGDETMLFEVYDEESMHITTTEQHGSKKSTEQIILVDGRWMLAKDVAIEKGYEIDALDAPVLMLRLALELLRAAAPGGPSTVVAKLDVNVREAHQPITISTMSASGGLPAPWAVQGVLEPAASGELAFDLTVRGGQQPIHFIGTWQKEQTPPVLPGDFSLQGWQVFAIGPFKVTKGHETIIDYGAQPSNTRAKTIAELKTQSTK